MKKIFRIQKNKHHYILQKKGWLGWKTLCNIDTGYGSYSDFCYIPTNKFIFKDLDEAKKSMRQCMNLYKTEYEKKTRYTTVLTSEDIYTESPLYRAIEGEDNAKV